MSFKTYVTIHKPLAGVARQRFMGLYGSDPKAEFFKLVGVLSTESGECSIETSAPKVVGDAQIVKVTFDSIPAEKVRHMEGVFGEKRRQQLLELKSASIKVEPPTVRPSWATTGKKADNNVDKPTDEAYRLK